jgi:hypothetical protein
MPASRSPRSLEPSVRHDISASLASRFCDGRRPCARRGCASRPYPEEARPSLPILSSLRSVGQGRPLVDRLGTGRQDRSSMGSTDGGSRVQGGRDGSPTIDIPAFAGFPAVVDPGPAWRGLSRDRRGLVQRWRGRSPAGLRCLLGAVRVPPDRHGPLQPVAGPAQPEPSPANQRVAGGTMRPVWGDPDGRGLNRWGRTLSCPSHRSGQVRRVPRSRLPDYPPWVLGIARWSWALTLVAGAVNVGLACSAIGLQHRGWRPDTVLQVAVGLVLLAVTPLGYKISRRAR